MVALSENNWVFFFGTTENWSNSTSFSKVSCNMESETLSKNFQDSVTLKYITLVCLAICTNLLPIHDWSFGKILVHCVTG